MFGREMINRNRSEAASLLRVLVIAVFAAVLVMGFAFPAFAYSASSTPFTYSGKIVAIDNTAKTVTVQAGMNSQIFRLNGIATVTKCNRPESFSNLKVGDEVTISYYQTSMNNNIANQVALSPAPGMMHQQCS